MRKARAELADLGIRLATDVFHEIHGDDYDLSALVTWCRTEGTNWFNEVTDLLFDPELERDLAKRDERIRAVCERHGLKLTEQGKPLDDSQTGPKIEAFLKELLLKHVRRKDGKPIDEQTAIHFLDELRQQDTVHPVDQALKKVIAQKYGGEEVLQARLVGLFIRVAGLHSVLGAHLQIDNVVSLPGHVVETNGVLITKDRVRWQADSSRAYPFGYKMEARSLDPDPAMLALLPGRPLANRDAMIGFIRLIAPHEPLRKALQECHKNRSLKPLRDYRRSLTARRDAGPELEALRTLEEMLELKPE
jgi:hypothetical protein